MILNMEKVTVLGIAEDKDLILKHLMKAKCAQIKDAETIKNYEAIRELTTSGEVNTYEFEQDLAKFEQVINALSFYEQKSKLFAKKATMTFEEINNKSLLEQAIVLRDKVINVIKENSDLTSKKNQENFLLSSLVPWSKLDVDTCFTETKSARVGYFVLSNSFPLDELRKQVSENVKECYIKEINNEGEFSYIAVLYHKSVEENVLDVLKQYNVVNMSFDGMNGTVKDNIVKTKNNIKNIDKKISDNQDILKEYAKDIELLKHGHDAVSIKIDGEKANENLFLTDKTFILTAWVIKNNEEDLKTALNEIDCYVSFEAPEEGEEPPVALKNNKFAEPFEVVTEMYSLPSPHGIDPNPLIAPSFILFFGMMLSDAGYGLLLILGGLLVPKYVQMSHSTKKFFKLFAMCGASTVFWGAIYGGWFGDVISVVARTFFGKEIIIPRIIDPLANPIIILGMSLLFGLIHIFVGMGTKAYMLIKRGKPLDAIFDVGFWYFLLGGLPLLAIGGTISTIGKYMAIFGAIGLVLTQGRHNKNIFMKVFGGVKSLYGITGYFSDVLSYARILALGLATGVIANVVNLMGSLVGGGIVGAILFLIIFIIGHTVNIGINVMGSYVHTARLQYVEFFGKFYEDGGQPFTPLRPDTKYTYIIDK